MAKPPPIRVPLVALAAGELLEFVVDVVDVLLQVPRAEVGLGAELAGVGAAHHPLQHLALAHGGPAAGGVEVLLQVVLVGEGDAAGGAGRRQLPVILGALVSGVGVEVNAQLGGVVLAVVDEDFLVGGDGPEHPVVDAALELGASQVLAALLAGMVGLGELVQVGVVGGAGVDVADGLLHGLGVVDDPGVAGLAPLLLQNLIVVGGDEGAGVGADHGADLDGGDAPVEEALAGLGHPAFADVQAKLVRRQELHAGVAMVGAGRHLHVATAVAPDGRVQVGVEPGVVGARQGAEDPLGRRRLLQVLLLPPRHLAAAALHARHLVLPVGVVGVLHGGALPGGLARGRRRTLLLGDALRLLLLDEAELDHLLPVLRDVLLPPQLDRALAGAWYAGGLVHVHLLGVADVGIRFFLAIVSLGLFLLGAVLLLGPAGDVFPTHLLLRRARGRLGGTVDVR